MDATIAAGELPAYLALIAPELILAGGALVLLMLGVFQGDRSTGLVSALVVATFALAAYAVIGLPADPHYAFSRSFVVDGFANFSKLLILLGSAIAVALAQRFIRNENIARFELPVLILLSTLGMLIMVSANDLIVLYIGLELQSLCAYVLASFNRDSLRSTEAGLKYFVLGALASGLLLYGASLIYGFAGTTNFVAIAQVVGANGTGFGLLLGLVFLVTGLAFKISAVPFHMWTPDVYEGAPTPVTAFFALAPKVAAMALLVRVLIEPFGAIAAQWQQIVIFLAVASMLLGSFAAIGQTNIKRLMAYSSIGHIGFALVGLAAGTPMGVQSVLIYMAIYLAMSAGAFAVILSMRRPDGMVENISDLAGLATNQPVLAAVLMIMMFSLAGIPPLAGFFAKLEVLRAALEVNMWPLAVIAVLATVVGAYYYLRIIKIMYFDDPAPAFEGPVGATTTLVLTGTSLFIGLYVVAPALLSAPAASAAASLFR